jgi:hypothetical protein
MNSKFISPYLNRRFGNARGVDRHDGAQDGLAQEGCHEDGGNGGHRRHEDTERYISPRNVRAQVASLTAIETADQYHARGQGLVQTKSLTQSKRQSWHHAVTQNELHDSGHGRFGNLYKVVGREGDAHTQHERGQSGGKVLGCEPGKGSRGF